MSTLFDDVKRILAAEGPAAAIDRLITKLRKTGQYGPMFYALLMKKRHELGVTPIPSRPAADLPDELHGPYEEAIRQAGRTVGQLYLDDGDIPAAWSYFRLIGEPQPVRDALDKLDLDEDADHYPVVEVAFHHGAHPRKGFDLVLDRQGICSAITLLGNFTTGLEPDVRAYCVRRLIESLHAQLLERLRFEIKQHDGREPPATASVADLISGRDWLFGEDYSHVDVSHLGSVVQMSLHLPPGDAALPKARELCAYGERLSPKMRYPGEPPFEDLYRDAGVYLRLLAGEDVGAGLTHFRSKVKTMDPDRGTLPAEVYVNLLLNAGREDEARAAARKYLAEVDERQLTCPSPLELCRRAGDYRGFAEVARARGDAVHFLAGLLAAAGPADRS